jgi:hypothetical protein
MITQLKTTFLSTLFFSLAINIVPGNSSVLAKPPTDTCADLQASANRIAKKQGREITFHGFEKLPMQTNVYQYATKPGTDRLCQLGYLTDISPMGKSICLANIYTNTESPKFSWGIGYFRTTFYAPVNRESEFCRWL